MNRPIDRVIAELPVDLRPPARRLHRHTAEVTDATTETLGSAFTLLRQVRGDPQQLAAGRDLLAQGVTTALRDAQRELDDTYPAVTAGWHGGSADVFARYIPRLSRAVESCGDTAAATADAVRTFSDSVASLWSKVIDKTQRTGDEVIAVTSRHATQRHLAVADVIDIVTGYADYVEDLSRTLLRLTPAEHAAGRKLSEVREAHAGLADNGRLRLPPADPSMTDESGWAPSAHVAVDTAAMAGLTAALSDNGNQFHRAAAQLSAAQEHFVPDSFGLAGAGFHDALHEVLADHHGLYDTAYTHLDALADTLRRIGAEYATGDDDIAAELRRGLPDT